MRYELFIGLRYLRSRRAEAFISLLTWIATAGVAIGVMTLCIVLSVMTGFEEDMRDRLLSFNPHVLVVSDDGPVSTPGSLRASVASLPGVVSAAPVIYGQVMFSSVRNMAGALVRGVPPDPSAFADVEKHLREGRLTQLGRRYPVVLNEGRGAAVELPGVILGNELAGDLGVGVGDPVTMLSPMTTTTAGGAAPRVKRFVVVGFFNSGMAQYDEALAFISLADAADFFGLGEAVTGLEVRVADVYEAHRVADRIAHTLGAPYRARDWMETNHNMFATFRLGKIVYFIVLQLITLVAAFNIVSTLIMVVMEKRKDIAVLKSMGATRAGIIRIFVFKGALIGSAGTLLGTLGGWVACWTLRRYEFIHLQQGVFGVSTLPVKIIPEYFVVIAFVSALICLLATLYPAQQAARLAPVDIIRYE